MFKAKLKELEDLAKNQSVETDDLHEFVRELSQEDLLINQTRNFSNDYKLFQNQKNKNTLQPRSLISSMLITPNLRKSYLNQTQSVLVQQQSVKHNQNDQNFYKIVNSDVLNEKTNQILDEQNRFKESLFQNFQEKLINLQKSKAQTQNLIDSLRTNLNEIEVLTANNIFKITSIK